jgi:hypothetical protein
MKCVCKTQMMPPPDHQNPVDMHTSIMCINILQANFAISSALLIRVCEYLKFSVRHRTDRMQISANPTKKLVVLQFVKLLTTDSPVEMEEPYLFWGH